MVITKVQQQLTLERSSIERGLLRIQAETERDQQSGLVGSVGGRLLRESTAGATVALRALQADITSKVETSWGGQKGRNPSERLLILSLEPEVLAFIAVRSIMTALSSERRLQSVALKIIGGIQDTLWIEECRELEKDAARARDYTPRNRIPKLVQALESYGPRVIKRWRKRLIDLPTTKWSTQERYKVGALILEAVLPSLSGVVSLVRLNAGTQGEQTLVRVTPRFVESIAQEQERVAFMRPFFLPMVIPPTEWRRDGLHITGGYRVLQAQALKTHGVGGHTPMEDIGQAHLDALNTLQAVPWSINNYVLANAQRAFQLDVGPLPYKPEVELPERLVDADWKGLDDNGRNEHLAARRLAYDHNNRQAEAKLAHKRALDVADEFGSEPQIYFPHGMDYRGRFYPIPQDLHPQGPDMVKALLMFGTAKALGSRGLVWLEQHAANTYGLDKADRTTQQTWTALNWDRIMLVGEDPWLDSEFWEAADEPWQFLAAARELYQAYKLSNPTEYMCALPVSVDGSCNGLQHLSAMGLDEVGGQAVNLTGGERSDIYQIVADKVTAAIPEDNEWFGKVTRKTVKRAVMTTPYGVTKMGIADQLKQDGFTQGMPNENQASQYLRDRIVDALEGTIVKGSEVMNWLKDCASVTNESQQGISWETPTGSVITMCNRRPKGIRVLTPLGFIMVQKDLAPGDELKVTKQRNSISPNIVHSFDAAHLAMVINAFEGDVAAVHDSYGTHACDVDKLLEVTKQQFIDIYSTDWFEKLRAGFIFHSDRDGMPAPPKRGTLDITKVNESDYFFA